MRPVKAALGRVEGSVAVPHAWFVEGCCMQEVRTAVVVKVVESIAVHGAHQTHGTTVRDAPPFVAKAVQDQLAATAKQLLQRFTLQTIAPAEMAVKASFSDEAFVKVEAAGVGPPRPWVRQTCQALLDTATEAANLLPAGDPLPAALVRQKSCPVGEYVHFASCLCVGGFCGALINQSWPCCRHRLRSGGREERVMMTLKQRMHPQRPLFSCLLDCSGRKAGYTCRISPGLYSLSLWRHAHIFCRQLWTH